MSVSSPSSSRRPDRHLAQQLGGYRLVTAHSRSQGEGQVDVVSIRIISRERIVDKAESCCYRKRRCLARLGQRHTRTPGPLKPLESVEILTVPPVGDNEKLSGETRRQASQRKEERT